MDELTKRLRAARTDLPALDALIADYQPLIRREAQRTYVSGLADEDRLSLAMLVFMQCVRQYQPERGWFLAYASLCIRNRLLDEGRKALRRQEVFLSPIHEEYTGELSAAERHAALASYDRDQERQRLAEEIEALKTALEEYGLSLSGLEEICPKQDRSRRLCIRLARAITQDAALFGIFQRTGRLPQASLAGRFRISPKTIEKHRRYIVVIVLILTGEYPGIRAFLPEGGDEA